MAGYTCERRTKEIGIRKVLGATVSRIIGMIYCDFGKLIAAALLIGILAVYSAAQPWLDSFAYHIRPGVTPIVIAALSVVSLTLFSIGVQAFKAAVANPVQSLRPE